MIRQDPSLLKTKKKNKLISEQNHYEKIKLIGQGTFGKVFLTKNRKDGKLYAIKQVLQDPKYKNRQLGIISKIDHQNIIFMIDYYIKIINQDYYLNIVMQYIPFSLSTLIKDQRKLKSPFPAIPRKLLMFQMFKALYYMQINNICHRDLKPPNVLINDQTWELKVCDFGSAKILQNKEKNVSYICSRYYRAPELILGSTAYATEIDVWSAGCIMVQFLTLEPIFPGDSSIQQLIQIIKILGTPPQSLIKQYQQANLTSLPLPKIKPNKWQKILCSYCPQPQFISLLSQILTYSTINRLSPIQILLHPYFHSLISNKQIQKLPNLFNFNSLYNRKNKYDIGRLESLYNKGNQRKYSLFKEKKRGDLEQIRQETMPSSTYSQSNHIEIIDKLDNQVKQYKLTTKNTQKYTDTTYKHAKTTSKLVTDQVHFEQNSTKTEQINNNEIIKDIDQ